MSYETFDYNIKWNITLLSLLLLSSEKSVFRLLDSRSTLNLTLEVLCQRTHTQTPPSRVTCTMTGLMLSLTTRNTHSLISEVQCHRMLTRIQLSPATSTTTGLLCKLMSTHNQTSVVQCQRTLTQIPPSLATSTMTGLSCKLEPRSILNQTSEVQCQRTPIQTQPSPATSIMTGLSCKLEPRSTLNQTSAVQCQRTLTQTPPSLPTSITTGPSEQSDEGSWMVNNDLSVSIQLAGCSSWLEASTRIRKSRSNQRVFSLTVFNFATPRSGSSWWEYIQTHIWWFSRQESSSQSQVAANRRESMLVFKYCH